MSYTRITILSVFAFINITLSQNLTVEKIEPPNWWQGMKLNEIQLMVYGTDLNDTEVSIYPAGINIKSIEEIQNSSYAFINIEVLPEAKPGNYKLIFKKNGRKVEKEFPLLERVKGERHQGFNSSDVIYLIMPDRFANGDESNDNHISYIDSLNRKRESGRHGGDLKGIINNLDYLKNLGITTIWMTPLVVNNTPMSYHGYGATDFYNIDPRLGTNEIYRNLVEEAHKRGLKIIMDHVANHFHRNHRWMSNLPVPEWIHGTLNDHLPADHNKMVFVDPYRDTISIKKVSEGWFTDYLVDLNQSNILVKNYIIQNTIWWTEYSGVDGIREDTYPYADQKFLADWAAVILEEYPGFNIVGEVWTGEPAYLSQFQTDSNARGFDSNLPSVTDFGVRDIYYEFLTGKSKLSDIYKILTMDYLYPDPGKLVTFIDNHDIARGMYYAKGNTDRMKIALILLMTTRGIPQLLYGTETNYTGGDSHGTLRFDFPGGFDGDSVNYFKKENLSAEQISYFEFLRDLLSLRKKHLALSEGKITHYPPAEGVYIYFKILGEDKFMIVINEEQEDKTISLGNYPGFQNVKLKEVFPGSSSDISDSLLVKGISGAIYKIE